MEYSWRYHPFQKIYNVVQQDGKKFVLAALGPYILVLQTSNGHILCRWPDRIFEFKSGDIGAGNDPDQDYGADNPNRESPSKRRKLSTASAEEERSRESSVSIEIRSERKKGQRRKQKLHVKPELSNVSHLIATENGEHVIAITTEDKCIRVLKLDSQGRLATLSTRSMPKRLCTIALNRDQDTILAGDKFGDVYALPLLPCHRQTIKAQQETYNEEAKPFVSSASELTVHTKGNREALRQQQIHRPVTKQKQEPDFDHELVLGHVSLLTDLVVGLDPLAGDQEYIVTSDRDEHIRVSRGIPQAHVIHNYCLGHSEFVSELRMLEPGSQYLVSGDGKPSLRIWNWLKGEIVAEASFEEELKQIHTAMHFDDQSEQPAQRAVACIQPLRLNVNNEQEQATLIVVALEGIPILFTYHFYQNLRCLKLAIKTTLPANVLCLSLLDEVEGLLLISLDNAHRPYSMVLPLSDIRTPMMEVLKLTVKDKENEVRHRYEWICQEKTRASPAEIHNFGMTDLVSRSDNGYHHQLALNLSKILEADAALYKVDFVKNATGSYSPLGEFLYGRENLRKKKIDVT